MKNWLIRTTDLQILGPVSRDKIKELLDNNSLKSNDEICSGNGYWFFVKESELVEKYVQQGAKQSFNPISEAKTIFSLPAQEQENLVDEAPKDEGDDITLVGVTLDALKEAEAQETPAPELPEEVEKIVEYEEDAIKPQKVSVKTFDVQNVQGVDGPSNKMGNQKVIYFLAAIFLVLAIGAFLYRKTLIKEFIDLSS